MCWAKNKLTENFNFFKVFFGKFDEYFVKYSQQKFGKEFAKKEKKKEIFFLLNGNYFGHPFGQLSGKCVFL